MLLIAILVALSIPPAQVAFSVLGSSFIPMRAQRRIEANEGQSLREALSRWCLWRTFQKIDALYLGVRGSGVLSIADSIFRESMAIAEAKGGRPRVSTITMQPGPSSSGRRSHSRKALEANHTMWMDSLMCKGRIMDPHLNHIEPGPGIYGIGAAAHEYFGKTSDQLTRSQMIALAAVLPNPLKWSPVRPNATLLRKIRRVERLSSRAPFPSEKLRGE